MHDTAPPLERQQDCIGGWEAEQVSEVGGVLALALFS